jgi:hypothetical protein
VRATTTKGSPTFVPPAERIAEFDQDGTLWVEHPVYTQVIYCLDRFGAFAREKPELKDREPFKTDDVKKWLATAKHPRWNCLYTELVYQPMLEVLHYLRANGYKTYIATGGSSGFVREYSDKVYGIPPRAGSRHRAGVQIRLRQGPAAHPHQGAQVGA